MNELLKETIEKIKESVKPEMDKWKEDRATWLKELARYCCHDVYRECEEKGLKKDAYTIHAMMAKKGYTKSCERYFHRSHEDFMELIEKDAETKMFNLERAAYKKLKGVDVKKVEKLWFHDNAGAWLINDEKTFSYEVIIAGGYNVQCLHIRVLFKFK
jgi:hypothetical protein